MADTTIDGNVLTLYDNWPGRPNVAYDSLSDFFTIAEQNVSSPRTFIPGDKAVIRNSGTSLGTAGPSIFTYLQALNNTTDSVAIAAKVICVPDVTLFPFRVTNDPDDILSLADGLCAVGLTTMTNLYFGWFWTGGQCPSDLISGLDGTFGTDDSVVVGDFTTVDLTANAMGFGIIAATTSACGYSSGADT